MAESTQTQSPAAEPKPIDVYDVIMVMVDNMAAIAWQKLGLQPDLITGKVEKDLVQAKTAIDLTTHLASFIEPRLDEEDKRRMHSLVRDLRINYVDKSKES
jgi:uncharacterized membrane-anchored protein